MQLFAERREIRKSRIYEYVVDMLVLAYALTLGFEAHSNHQSQRFDEEFWVWGWGDMSLKTSTMMFSKLSWPGGRGTVLP